MKTPLQLQSIADVGINQPQTGDVLVFDGKVWVNGFKISTTLVGAAGPASALPATPQGYIALTVNGKPYVVPYYNP